MIELDVPYIFFECCKVVFGSKKSLIYDFQRQKLYPLPTSVLKILKNNNKKKLNSFLNRFSLNNQEILKDTIQHLYDIEVIFFSNKISSFPNISISYDFPSIISNAIIIHNPFVNYENLFWELNTFNCKALEIIVPKNVKNRFDFNIINSLNEHSIEVINFHIDNEKKIDIASIEALSMAPRVNNIYIWDKNKKLLQNNFSNLTNQNKKIFLIQGELALHQCGKIGLEQMTLNFYHFTESIHHNSCLNRKISIDSEGKIKNCPSMLESFGNIRDTTLAEAIEKPGFKKYWDINKDKIHVCKDCEFRYICTDCRAYVEDPDDILSKPLKCGYNPYTGEWSEWSTNPLKQKTIDYYGMREMVDEMNKGDTAE